MLSSHIGRDAPRIVIPAIEALIRTRDVPGRGEGRGFYLQRARWVATEMQEKAAEASSLSQLVDSEIAFLREENAHQRWQFLSHSGAAQHLECL